MRDMHSECVLFYLLKTYCIVCITATVVQLHIGGDMMYEMRRKSESTLLPNQGILNLPHHIGMVLEEMASDDTVNYTQRGKGLSIGKSYGSDRICTPVSGLTN